MTIRSIAALAVQRDAAASTGELPDPAAFPASGPAPSVRAASDVLMAAVPIDVVVLYTTVLGVLSGVVPDNEPNSYLGLRWGLYLGCLVATVLAVWVAYRVAPRPPGAVVKRRVPWAEMGTASFAFATWGLVLPDSVLYALLDPPTLPVIVAVLAAFGAFVFTAVLTPLLGRAIHGSQ
ncbi:hypothetical protein HH310_11095 [Actinoplanes sp. TBRC 11911]|uniref:hypothetical protein n=1 Tax=Actinoplanes sp. TBRC 11911 TaxID=2729386 RepID=UPI00145DF540|nr:hypothetical protein [Actinoplanes sp. TBRC 11911]NMO51736.1 hypothetical protein [Actinoplanes sp. TBRC 11911]